MQTTVIYAFLVVACAPIIGIWRGHSWAKRNGMVLRPKETRDSQDQIA
jgi:hypothetical protein